MSVKEKLHSVIESLPDTASIDEAMHRIGLIRDLEISPAPADRDPASNVARASQTTKQIILETVGQLPDETSFDAAIDRLTFLRGLEVALKQSDADDVMDQEEFERELAEEERRYRAENRLDS